MFTKLSTASPLIKKSCHLKMRGGALLWGRISTLSCPHLFSHFPLPSHWPVLHLSENQRFLCFILSWICIGNVSMEHFQRAKSANKRTPSLLCDSSSGQNFTMCDLQGIGFPDDNFPSCPREIWFNTKLIWARNKLRLFNKFKYFNLEKRKNATFLIYIFSIENNFWGNLLNKNTDFLGCCDGKKIQEGAGEEVHRMWGWRGKSWEKSIAGSCQICWNLCWLARWIRPQNIELVRFMTGNLRNIPVIQNMLSEWGIFCSIDRSM